MAAMPAAATPLKLTPEITALVNNALADKAPMLFIAVDPEGKPLPSFRGSLQGLGNDQLGLWVRNVEGGTLQAVRLNPAVSCVYRNGQTNAMLMFHGRARIAGTDEDRARVYDNAPELERRADPDRKGIALIVDLDRVQGILGYGPDGPVGFTRMERGA